MFVLAYVGVTLMLSHHYPIPNLVSLAIIGGNLAVGVLASLFSSRDTAPLVSPLADENDSQQKDLERHDEWK